MTHAAPAVLLKADVIPSHLIAQLDAGEVPLSGLPAALGLPRTMKNGVYSRLAKMVKAGLAPSTLLRFSSVSSLHDRLGDVVTPDLEKSDTAAAAQVDSLRRKLGDMTARARAAEGRIEEESALASVIAGLTASKATPPDWLRADFIPHTEPLQESVPIVILTDWHLGEVVKPGEAGGYTYNAAIAHDRVRRSVEKAIHLTKDSLKGLRFPGVVCALGGDLVSGALHPELAESDEYSVLKSILVARDLVVGAINALKSEFGLVFVPCAVGNHGRAFDRKPRAKGYAHRNIDWLIYELVATHFSDDPCVTVVNPDAGETLFKIYGRTFLLSHGDQLGTRGGDGIIGAIGPIIRGSLKTLKSLGSLGHDIDHLIVGHWHQQIHLPQVTVCGSLKGPDEYTMRMLRAPAEDPSQTLMVVHPEHGITFRQALFLRDEHCPNRSQASTDKRWLAVFGDAA